MTVLLPSSYTAMGTQGGLPLTFSMAYAVWRRETSTAGAVRVVARRPVGDVSGVRARSAGSSQVTATMEVVSKDRRRQKKARPAWVNSGIVVSSPAFSGR